MFDTIKMSLNERDIIPYMKGMIENDKRKTKKSKCKKGKKYFIG